MTVAPVAALPWRHRTAAADVPGSRDSTHRASSSPVTGQPSFVGGDGAAAATVLLSRADEPVAEAALQYARRGWPVLPGAAWNGRRFVVGGSGAIAHRLRPVVPRTFASADPHQVAKWWGVDEEWEPSVLLVVGPAFDVVSVAGAVAAGLLFTRAFQKAGGPVVFRPDSGAAHFLLEPGGARRLRSTAPPAIRPLAAGSWIPAPPTLVGNGARVSWWCHPARSGWRPMAADAFLAAVAAAQARRTARRR